MVSALQITLYQIGGSFSEKTCEHINARAALQDASKRVDMFASRVIFQLSKNETVLHLKEGSFYIIPVSRGEATTAFI